MQRSHPACAQSKPKAENLCISISDRQVTEMYKGMSATGTSSQKDCSSRTWVPVADFGICSGPNQLLPVTGLSENFLHNAKRLARFEPAHQPILQICLWLLFQA